MTSDAKIGLLLGLVFIFIIAFVINGLPNFHKHTDNSNEMTTNLVMRNNTLGLAAREHKAQETINRTETVSPQPAGDQATAPAAVSALPAATVSSADAGENAATSAPAGDNALAEAGAEPAPDVRTVADAQPTSAAEQQPAGAKSDEVIPKNTYVVCKGDSLATIAKKFYGAEEGNKRANILRIFEANRKLLRSADELDVGQKLTIPSMPGSVLPEKSDKNKAVVANVVPVGKTPKKVELAAAKHSSAIDNKIKDNGHYYTVREGDSLWKIAADQLGNGNRYTEIVRLNPNIINDDLDTGARLKMPVQ